MHTAVRRDRHVRYLTRTHLIECTRLGYGWDINRQAIERVADRPDRRFPIVQTLFQPHRNGVPSNDLVRCVTLLRPSQYATLDLPTGYYQTLPVIRR